MSLFGELNKGLAKAIHYSEEDISKAHLKRLCCVRECPVG